jgi:hypothetical protein
MPAICSISPSSGAVGATVTIRGYNFLPPLSIVFGGNVEAAGNFTATVITVTVPAGALSGDITVSTSGGSAQSSPFTVEAPTPTPTPA